MKWRAVRVDRPQRNATPIIRQTQCFDATVDTKCGRPGNASREASPPRPQRRVRHIELRSPSPLVNLRANPAPITSMVSSRRTRTQVRQQRVRAPTRRTTTPAKATTANSHPSRRATAGNSDTAVAGRPPAGRRSHNSTPTTDTAI